MALPDDMQHVPVILLKERVAQIDALVQQERRDGNRRASRSLVLRELIDRAIDAFFVVDGSEIRTKSFERDTAA